MQEADSVLSTPRKTAFKIVGGTDCATELFPADEASIHQLSGRSGRWLPEPATETCRNQRLRLTRREVWRRAGFTTRYWRARLDWDSALSWAQRQGIGDAKSFPR